MVWETFNMSETVDIIINKMNGIIIYSISGFAPNSAENKYLWAVGKTKERGIFFRTKTSTFTLIENYKGYKIVLQEWYKNIRQSNNQLNNVLIYKGEDKIKEYCLPRIFDFTFDNTSFYIYSDSDIYRFNFDEIINGL